VIPDLAQRVADQLGRIDGVVAVVLGGSHARGEARPDSDIDLGIYYRPNRPPSVAALRALAQELDDRHPPDAATEFGAWGPWINGGAWLQIARQRIDWLYRDLDLVARVIDGCRAGRTTCYYQPGHPAGFHDHIYMGEVHYCRPLSDPGNALATFKALTVPYPPLLKRALIDTYLWEADFSLAIARKPAARGDVFFVDGCLFRVVACLVQVLFALNERYVINEKGALPAVAALPLHPPGFVLAVEKRLARPGGDVVALLESLEGLSACVEAVRAICAESLRIADNPAWHAGLA
jgi:hypothetical protein